MSSSATPIVAALAAADSTTTSPKRTRKKRDAASVVSDADAERVVARRTRSRTAATLAPASSSAVVADTSPDSALATAPRDDATDTTATAAATAAIITTVDDDGDRDSKSESKRPQAAVKAKRRKSADVNAGTGASSDASSESAAEGGKKKQKQAKAAKLKTKPKPKAAKATKKDEPAKQPEEKKEKEKKEKEKKARAPRATKKKVVEAPPPPPPPLVAVTGATYPTINMGYCCLNMTLRDARPTVFTNRGMVKATWEEKGVAHASKLALANVTDLLAILKWNEQHNIRLFRITSVMFPWWSEYKLEDLADFDAISSALMAVGDYARAHGHRLTMHPDHFCVLASPSESIVKKTITELNHSSQLFDLMGYAPSHFNKINIHVRGVYGGKGVMTAAERAAAKRASMDRFAERWALLSPGCRKRLTVENDDTPGAYTVDDLAYLHDKIGIPIVYDAHHQKFCHGAMSAEQAFRYALSTWPAGVRPIVHWSESQHGRKPLAHSDYVHGPVSFYGSDALVDCMLECKNKEQALLRYRPLLHPIASASSSASSSSSSSSS